MGKQAFSVNITADEVIAPGSTIELAFAAPVEEKSAQGAIRVTCGCEPRSVRIEVAKRGRLVRVNVDETVLGACRLVIAELLGAKGERLVDTYGLPFSVAPLPGKLPAGLRVEHAVRLVIGDLHVERVALGKTPAGYVDLVKAVHRTTGRPAELGLRRARQAGRRRGPAGGAGRSPRRQVRPHSRDAVRAARASPRQRAHPDRRVAAPRPAPRSLQQGNRSPDAGGSGGRAESPRSAPRTGLQAARRTQALGCRARPRPAHRQRAALCQGDGDCHADTEPRREQERRRDPVRRHERADRPRQLDRGCAHRSGAPGRLRRHRHSRRGLGGRSQRHHEPHVRGPLHDDARGERSRAPDLGDREEHRGEPASRPRSGLRPLLGQQRQRGRAALGRARPALHGREPELPPRDGARRVNSAVGRPAQGLAGAALAVSDDRAGGRELLAGGRGRHQPAGGRVRQSQGLQLPGARQSRRHRRGDVGGLGLPQPGLDARRPRAAGAGRERHRGVGEYRDDVGHELRLARRRGRHSAAAGRRRGAVLLARGLPRDPDGLGRAQHQRQHVVAGRGEPRRRPRRRRSGRRRVRRRDRPAAPVAQTRPALGGAGTSGRSPRA